MAFIGNTNTTQGFIPAIDYFSGNGSTVAFTLSRPVASVAQVQANISNVPQNPGSAYTVSGNTITFTSAPPSGTNNIYVYYTSPITQVITPGQETVGTTQLQNGLTVNFADGSAAAPSITNDGDTNTGMFFPAADTVAITTGGSERMRVDSSGNVGVGNTVASTITTANGWPGLVVGSGTGAWGATIYSGSASNGGLAFANGTTTTATYNGYVSYNHNTNAMTFATNAGVERVRIDSSGNLLVGTTSALVTPSRIAIVYPGDSTWGIGFKSSYLTGNGQPCTFINSSNAVIGYISTTGTATSYVTSSDYRLKEDIAPMTGALAKVQVLNPVTYKWKSDGSAGEGFIAHELAEICPHAVTGEKDAVDADGNPKYQGIDTSFLVATLTAAIKEQQALITALTARITALENK